MASTFIDFFKKYFGAVFRNVAVPGTGRAHKVQDVDASFQPVFIEGIRADFHEGELVTAVRAFIVREYHFRLHDLSKLRENADIDFLRRGG